MKHPRHARSVFTHLRSTCRVNKESYPLGMTAFGYRFMKLTFQRALRSLFYRGKRLLGARPYSYVGRELPTIIEATASLSGYLTESSRSVTTYLLTVPAALCSVTQFDLLYASDVIIPTRNNCSTWSLAFTLCSIKHYQRINMKLL